ncbi:MAG: type III-A CRISPR-associated RAMP protein Csm4 [Clostridia bacterium]|nr:type III-A CRISPR-associated RAMP protein Csm4 [Clostridia bacterium]
MKKSIIKLKFLTPLHLGKGRLSDSEYQIKADTIFSALCIESNNIPKLVSQVKEGQLKISDAFPYIEDYYYLPKPMIYIDQQTEEYKLFKKIKYITEDTLKFYLEGSLNPEDELASFILGESHVRTQVNVGGDPYQVGTFSFQENSGLYIIVEHGDDYVFDVFEKLQYSGIGGKRSSGLGRFSFHVEKAFEFSIGEYQLLLNTAMARDEELDQALEGANYLLQKRSGFIHQSRYKKRDFYTFKAGSVFKNKFEGDLFDVGNDEHPVYSYGVPMFMGVTP